MGHNVSYIYVVYAMSIAANLVHAEESALDLPGLEPSSSEWKALPRYFYYCFEQYISVFHLIMHSLFSLSDLVTLKTRL